MPRWILAGLVVLASAPEADAKMVRMLVSRYAYRDPGIVILSPSVDYGGIRAETHDPGSTWAHGPQLGVSMLGISAGDRDLQGQAGLGYRRMDLAALEIEEREKVEFVESMVGLRYFPRAPTLLLRESFCVRLIASASGGAAVSLNGDVNFPIDLTAGLHFAPGRTPSGLAVELVHRPNRYNLKYRPHEEPGDPVAPEEKFDIAAWTALRVSFFFGP